MVSSVGIADTNVLGIEFVLVSQPPAVGTAECTLQVLGIPNVRRSSNGTFPIAAQIGGAPDTIELEYDGPPIATDEEFVIGPYDNAVRSPLGGFMAPGYVIAPEV